MKCQKCKAEWTAGSVKSQFSTCPFCGASLISTVAMDDDQTMTSVMVRIVEHFGEEILSQESKCMAAFKDFAPKMEKEQKILKIAFGEGVSNYFLHCPVADRESHMQKARQSMNALLSDEVSLLVVNAFAMSLGWSACDTRKNFDDTKEIKNEKNISKQNIKMPEKTVGQKNEEYYALGKAYYYGRGVIQDYSEAMKWYRKAADAGNTDAMQYIGFMYREGQGVERDTNEANRWFLKATNAVGQKKSSIPIEDKLEINKNDSIAFHKVVPMKVPANSTQRCSSCKFYDCTDSKCSNNHWTEFGSSICNQYERVPKGVPFEVPINSAQNCRSCKFFVPMGSKCSHSQCTMYRKYVHPGAYLCDLYERKY